MKYSFADLLLDTGRRQLSRGSEKIPLPPLSYRVLQTLIDASPDMVSPDELVDRAWGANRVVTPENINQRIMLLRQSLGDDAQQPRYVEAVRGQGFRMIPEVHHGESLAEPRQRFRLPAGIGLVIAVAVALWLAWPEPVTETTVEPRADSSTESLPEIDLQRGPVVAVLPFESMSDDTETRYIGDGVSEDIIHTLVQQTGLPVVARTSSFQFRGQNLDGREIGRRLHATHLLEGSVRRFDTQVRVTAQLIDAPSGMHVWSEQYDRPLEDLFMVQSDIAHAIVGRIKDQLQAQGETRIQDAISLQTMQPMGRAAPAAYEAYLKGLQHRNRLLPDDIRTALEYFEQSATLSPEFFPAWRALIDTQLVATSVPIYIDFELTAYERIEDWLEQARTLHPDEPYLEFMGSVMQAVNHLEWQDGIRRMEQVLPRLRNDASAQAMAGWIYLVTERESQARNHLERALVLDPNSAMAMSAISWLNWVAGRENEVLSLLSVAEDDAGHNDELAYFKTFLKGILLLQRSELEVSDKELRRAAAFVDPNHTPMRGARAFLEAQKSGDAEAFTEARRDMFSKMWEIPVNIFQTTAGGALFDEFVFEAIRQRQIDLFWYIYHNRLSPRFKELVTAVGLADFPEPQVRINRLDENQVAALLEAEYPVSDEELQKYEGVYYVGDYGLGRHALVVTLENARLSYFTPGLKGGRLVATSERTFVSLDERNKKIEFVPNDLGEIDLAFWNLGDFDYHGYRQETDVR